MASGVKKVVLAYSGGLDTSVILRWLQTTYGCEVVTFTADLGQSAEDGGAELAAVLIEYGDAHAERAEICACHYAHEMPLCTACALDRRNAALAF